MYLIEKYVNFIAAITEMYQRIPWEPVADPLGCAEHNSGNSGIEPPITLRRQLRKFPKRLLHQTNS